MKCPQHGEYFPFGRCLWSALDGKPCKYTPRILRDKKTAKQIKSLQNRCRHMFIEVMTTIESKDKKHREITTLRCPKCEKIKVKYGRFKCC